MIALPVRLVFLGRLEDLAGAAELPLAIDAPQPLANVFARLDEPLASALHAAEVRVAINGALLNDTEGATIAPGDEVAFLPPVSGG